MAAGRKSKAFDPALTAWTDEGTAENEKDPNIVCYEKLRWTSSLMPCRTWQRVRAALTKTAHWFSGRKGTMTVTQSRKGMDGGCLDPEVWCNCLSGGRHGRIMGVWGGACRCKRKSCSGVFRRH